MIKNVNLSLSGLELESETASDSSYLNLLSALESRLRPLVHEKLERKSFDFLQSFFLFKLVHYSGRLRQTL